MGQITRSSPDWLRNLMAAREATLVHDGEEFEVSEPVVVPISDFPGRAAFAQRLYGIELCLRLTRSDVTAPAPSAP